MHACNHTVDFRPLTCIVHVQQIAFKNLLRRNEKAEEEAGREPHPSSIVQLPFVLVNADRRAVINCQMADDRCDPRLHFIPAPFE